jgi:hypothetical protein
MDIVERLHESPCSGDIGCAHKLCVEAADVIEKLRKLNVDQTRQLFEADNKYRQLVDKVRVWVKEKE